MIHLNEETKSLLYSANQINSAIAKIESSNVFTDDEKIKLANLNNYDDSDIISEINALKNNNGLLNTTIGYTIKNLLQVTAETTTVSGVTMVVNSDGSLSLSGTATERTVIPITNRSNRNSISILPPKIILSGGTQMLGIECCIGIELSTGLNSGYITSAYDGDNGRLFDLSAYPTANYWYTYMRIYEGINVDGITIYPMIRDANILDPTYVPYTKPSIEERLSALEDSIVKLTAWTNSTS